MSNNNRGKFMKVSVELLEMIDYSKPYEMQLALTLLYKGSATYFAWDDALVETTPAMLVQMFGNYSKINARQLASVVGALTDMRDRGLIAFDGDIKPKDAVVIDTTNLVELSQQKPHVELLIKDFYSIMQTDDKIIVNKKEVSVNGIESYLLQAFLVAKARWNFKTIDMLKEVDDFNYAIGSFEEVQQAKGVFCSDTLDFIRSHKHYDLDEVENWCSDDYLSGYLNKLQDLGCLRIHRYKLLQNGAWAKRNFYYEPTMSFECIDAMVRQYARRHNYTFKEDEVKEEVKSVDCKDSNSDDTFKKVYGRRRLNK